VDKLMLIVVNTMK